MASPDAADIARMRRIITRLASYGVEVREMPGHEARGFRYAATPSRVFDHHDASSRKSGEWGSLGLILDGTPRGIPGPLSNFQVARCLDGVPKVGIVADGYTYHAGIGGPWNELPTNDANPRTYGTEKANDGLGEPYTAAANYATNALFHAVAVECGGAPESFPVGHKEWTTRKSDPTYSMADRRAQVAAFTPTYQEDPFMALSDQQQIDLATTVGLTHYALLSLIKPSTDQIPGLLAAITTLAQANAAGRDDLTAEELEAAVVKALRENAVKISVDVAPGLRTE